MEVAPITESLQKILAPNGMIPHHLVVFLTLEPFAYGFYAVA
jgi:hypothetical protein